MHAWPLQVHGPGCIRCTLNLPRVQAEQSRCTTVRNSHYKILGRHAGTVQVDAQNIPCCTSAMPASAAVPQMHDEPPAANI